MGETESTREDKRLIYQTVASGASGLYKTTLTIASTFLGGSLLFLEKFAPHPSTWSKLILAFGWLLLVAAIGLTMRVQRLNNRCGYYALEEKRDRSDAIYKQADRWTEGGNWCLILGIGVIMLFGFLNLPMKG